MTNRISKTVFALSALSITQPALAQTATPVCADLVVPLTGIPADAPFQITLPPAILLAQCSVSDGTALTLVNPEQGISITPAPNSSQTVIYTVKDSHDNEVVGKVVVTRN